MRCFKQINRSTSVRIIIGTLLVLLLWSVTGPMSPWGGMVSQRDACINNLLLIDSAKRQWALEHHKQSTATPQGSDLEPYLGRNGGELPCCPADPSYTFVTSYNPRNVGADPVCRQDPATHVLPRLPRLYKPELALKYPPLPGHIVRFLAVMGVALCMFDCWQRLEKGMQP